MKLHVEGKKAIMTSNWAEAVEGFDIEEEDICIFCFTDGNEGLELLIYPILPFLVYGKELQYI